MDEKSKNERNPSPIQIMVCIDCRDVSSHPRREPLSTESLRARPYPPATSATLRPSLGDSDLSRRTAHNGSTRRCLHRSNRRPADTLSIKELYYFPARSSRSTCRRQCWCCQCGGSSCSAASDPSEIRPSRSRKLRKAQAACACWGVNVRERRGKEGSPRGNDMYAALNPCRSFANPRCQGNRVKIPTAHQ
jgi:hypothetical protein